MKRSNVVAICCHFHGNENRNSFRAVGTKRCVDRHRVQKCIPLMIKTLNKLKIGGNFVNLIKSIFEKLMANVILVVNY